MIVLISGTNRPGSNTRKIVAHLETFYAELQVPARVLDLIQLPPDIFSPAAYAEKPRAFLPYADAILQSAGLHVVTPEYNGSLPGALKYFIDMLKFPESFDLKPVCFTGLSAGAWGGLRPVEHLQQIFGYRNAHIYPGRVFLSHVHNLLDASGQLKDAELLQRLKKQAEGFAQFVERLKNVKLRGAKA